MRQVLQQQYVVLEGHSADLRSRRFELFSCLSDYDQTNVRPFLSEVGEGADENVVPFLVFEGAYSQDGAPAGEVIWKRWVML